MVVIVKNAQILVVKIVLILLSGVLASASPANAAADTTNTIKIAIKQLDLRFRDLSPIAVKYYIKKNTSTMTLIKDSKQLQKTVREHINNNKHLAAIAYITSNIDTIKNTIDDTSTFYFTKLLLENNAWHTANQLFQYAQQQAENYTVAQINFYFARYYFFKHDWENTQKQLHLNFSYEALPEHNFHYTHIMNGVLLQQQKQHRKAVKHYIKVPPTSEHYTYAQLNTAIAYIRQGWWTDAHIAINKALNQKLPPEPSVEVDKHSEELTNRLYLVLGYLLIQNEYYRDAREAFRNITLESVYKKRALLGLALSAASQGDYVASLNALRRLNEIPHYALSVDESYLLLAFVYEKLNQQITASASYTTAINYYESRINDIERSLKNSTIESLLGLSEKNSINLFQKYSASFFSNRDKLRVFQQEIDDPKLIRKTNSLLNDYDKYVTKLITLALNERMSYLNDYLNQARFGIANTFDKE